MENTDSSSGSLGKVARVIEKYDLRGVGNELEAYWTAGDDRMSLRELAAYFNKRVLESVLTDHDVDTLAGEADNIYELLTDDDVTSGVRTQAENRLESHGIDVDQLRSDFVSRQAISTYLKKGRGAEYEAVELDDEAVVDRRLEDLQRLKSRQSAVTEQTLSSLRDNGHITLGEFQTLVSVRIQCTDCNSQFDIVDLVDRGGCDCHDD